MKNSMDYVPLLVGGGMLLMGSSFFAVSFILLLRKIFKIKRSAKTTGVVMNVEESLGMRQSNSSGYSSRNTLYKPTVRFQTADGRTVDYTPQTSNSWSNYKVGENVPVYYESHQPEKAIIGRPFQLWFGLIIFGFVGGFFALMGVFFLIVSQMFP